MIRCTGEGEEAMNTSFVAAWTPSFVCGLKYLLARSIIVVPPSGLPVASVATVGCFRAFKFLSQEFTYLVHARPQTARCWLHVNPLGIKGLNSFLLPPAISYVCAWNVCLLVDRGNIAGRSRLRARLAQKKIHSEYAGICTLTHTTQAHTLAAPR